MTNQGTITFQVATNYLPKVALRIESLYKTIQDACEETHPAIHHCAILNLLEILRLIEKPELKSRFLKEFMRIMHNLHKPSVEISDELQKRLQHQIHILTHEVGRFGEVVLQDPFLQSINFSPPLYSLDSESLSPQFLLWLESNFELRRYDLTHWINGLGALYSTVNLYLSLFRDSAQFDTIGMLNGFYQCQLTTKAICHLILLRIDKSFGLVPKMQMGQHGLSLRLCEMKTMREIRETQAKLDLAICQL